MAKTISNKKYEEFWNKDELDIKKDDNIDKKDIGKEDISKEIKKEVKKEVKKLEEKVNEISKKNIEKDVDDNIESNDKPKKPRKRRTSVVKQEEKEEQKKIIEKNITVNKTKKDIIIENEPINIYESYTIGNKPYRIYHRGNLIYDSVNHTEKPIFKENEFILFGKNYIYRGIRIEKY